MKKIILIITIVIVVIVIFGGLSYLITGRIVPSTSCGNDFNNQFRQAVANNDLNFCSTFKGDVTYSKDPLYGTYYCKVPKIGDNVNNSAIHQNDFKNSCLENMAVISNNIDACKAIDKDKAYSCVLSVVRNSGNKEYCNLITEDEMLRAQCKIGNSTDASSTISICNTISSESVRDACIENFSQRVGDKQYCSLITDQEMKDFCLSSRSQ